MGVGKNDKSTAGLDFSAFVESLSEVEFANLYAAADRRLRAKFGVEEDALDAVCVDARKLGPDTSAVLAWTNGSEKLPQPGFPSPGCEAAIRFLEALNDPRGDALAGALKDPGSSKMKFVLKLVQRGRGRRTNEARLAFEKIKLATAAEAEIAKNEAERGGKPRRDGEILRAAEIAGRRRSTGYHSVAALRRAKGLEKE
jgi:hypothetical protein